MTRAWATATATRWQRSGTSCRCSSRSTRSRSPQPTPAQPRAPCRASPSGAERYLNRGLRPCPATRPTRATATPDTETWFDDNGWWGTRVHRGLPRHRQRAAACRRRTGAALHRRRRLGPAAGRHLVEHRAPLQGRARRSPSDTLLATLIYQQTHSRLRARARRAGSWPGRTRRGSAPPTACTRAAPQPDADRLHRGAADLRAGGALPPDRRRPANAQRAERLKATALHRFGYLLDFSPQYDAIYLQWMLALYSLDHDPTLYALAADNARDAQTRALERRRALPALLERRDAPAQDAEAGHAADAGRDHQPVRLAGRLPAAALSGGSTLRARAAAHDAVEHAVGQHALGEQHRLRVAADQRSGPSSAAR